MKFFRFYHWHVNGVLKPYWDWAKIDGILFYLFLIALPLGKRKILAQFTGGFDEYETVFLYLSDILLVLFLLISFREIRQFAAARKKEAWFLSLLIFFLAAAFSVSLALFPGLAFINLLRLAFLILLALSVGVGIHTGWLRLRVIFLILIFLGVFEAMLGVSQFMFQENIGFSFIGEPYLPGFITSLAPAGAPAGIAKIDIDGGKLIRSYGTFPHPNILAAFLLLSLVPLFYFWAKNTFDWRVFFYAGVGKKMSKEFWVYVSRELLLGVGIFIVSLGLLFTFSRSAWLVAACLWVTFSVFALLKPESRRQAVKLFFLCLAIGYIFSVAFSFLVFPRAHISPGEPAVAYRLSYNRMALDIIKSHPLGVGIGNQVIYSVKNQIYQKFGMHELWSWQPVHNIYLLMASEIGILGLLAFLTFIVTLIVTSIWRHVLWDAGGLEVFASLMSLVALLLFGIVDHFLWTLQPGRIILWLAIGLVLGLNKKTNP